MQLHNKLGTMVKSHSMPRSTHDIKIQSTTRPLDFIVFESRHFAESGTVLGFTIAQLVLMQHTKQAA